MYKARLAPDVDFVPPEGADYSLTGAFYHGGADASRHNMPVSPHIGGREMLNAYLRVGLLFMN